MSEFYPSSDDESLTGHVCILISDTFTRSDIIVNTLKSRKDINMLIFKNKSININLIKSLIYELNKSSMQLSFNFNDIKQCVSDIYNCASELYIFHDGHSNSAQLVSIGNALANRGMPGYIIQHPLIDPRTISGAY